MLFPRKYGGQITKKIAVRDLCFGDAIWWQEGDAEERRIVSHVVYHPKKELVRLYYDGYIGDDWWGATALVDKEVTK